VTDKQAIDLLSSRMPKGTLSADQVIWLLRQDSDFPIQSFVQSCQSIDRLTKQEEAIIREHCKKAHLKERYLLKLTAVKNARGLPGLVA
jgi:hypothetical protein